MAELADAPGLGPGGLRLVEVQILSPASTLRRYDSVVRRARVAVAALSILFATAGEASAAGTARLQVFPEQPRTGEAAVVQLRTFSLLEGTPPVVYPKDHQWSVAAYGRRDQVLRIRLTRDPSDPFTWNGRVHFPAPGRWVVCVLDFQFFSNPDRGCSTTNRRQLPVRVQAKAAPVDVWHRLQRPLRIPSISPGAPCPTAAPDPRGDLTRIGFGGIAWGGGPAYPAGGLGPGPRPLLGYLDPIPNSSGFFGSGWFGNKVLWVVDPAYRGPVLIRGRRLDGPEELRFDSRAPLQRELRIDAIPSIAAAAARDHPSFTRVRGPGCYAYQVDGLSFSYPIAFEAQPFDR